jgi:acyl transferase domain-containing protein
LPVSARSRTALIESCRRLAAHLTKNGHEALPNVAATLQLGRKHLMHREYVVASSMSEAVRSLELAILRARPEECLPAGTEVVFVCPGDTALSPAVISGLYVSEPCFRLHFDKCNYALRSLLGRDLLETLNTPERLVENEEWSHAATFALQYSLIRLWRNWGVMPSALVGCGVGEYVAACSSGLFSLENALRLVVARGRLLRESVGGGTGLHTDDYARNLEAVHWGDLGEPWLSGRTGEPVKRLEVAHPAYWLEEVSNGTDGQSCAPQMKVSSMGVRLEMGTGIVSDDRVRSESKLLSPGPAELVSRRQDERDEYKLLLYSLGRIWQLGAGVDWRSFNAPYSIRRVSLPTYPFERREHWIETGTVRQSR